MQYPEVCDKKYKFYKSWQHFLRFLIHLITIIQISLLCNLANATAVSARDSERIAAEASGQSQQETDREPTIELNEGEKAWLKAHPRIVLGIPGSWAPYVVVGEDGVVRGLDADYIALLNKKLGIRIELRTGKWVDMVAAAKAHEIDGLANSAPVEERRTHFHFSNSYTTLYKYIVIQEDADFEVRDLQDLAGRTVAVQRGIAFDREMLDKVGNIDIVDTDSIRESFNQLQEGKADAILGGIILLSQLAPDEVDHIKVAYVIKEKPLRLVYSIRKDWPELVGIINKGLAAISQTEHDDIRAKWLHAASAVQEKLAPPRLELTAAEQAWLAEHPVIRASNEGDWPPFNFSKDGQATGYSIEYLNLLAARIGVEVEYVHASWSDLLRMVKDRKLDVMTDVVASKKRAEYMLFTPEYVTNPLGIFVNASRSDIRSLDDLRHGKKVSFGKGYIHGEVLRRLYPEMTLIPVVNSEEGLKAVSAGSVDAHIGWTAPCNYYIGKNFLSNVQLVDKTGINEIDKFDVRIGIRSDWPLLAGILNKAMETITQEEKINIQNKWLSLSREMMTQRVYLTPQEKAWLVEHPRLSMGFDAAYPPFDFLGEDGQHAGIIADYLEIISERLGITIEPVYGLSWSEVLEKAKRKEIDLVSLLTKTEQRSQYMQFSKPFISTHLVLVTRDDMPFVTGLEDFSGKRVALLKNYKSYKLIPERYPEIVPQPTETPLEALKAIATGKVEGAVIDLPVAAYLIRKHSISNLKFAAPIQLPLPPKSIGVRDDLPMLVSILDKALASISEEERQAIRQKWIGLKYEEKIDYTLIWKTVAGFTALLLVVLLWIWKTRQQNELLRKTQQALQKSEARLANFFEASFEGLFLHEDGKILDVNPATSEIFGYDPEETIGRNLLEFVAPESREMVMAYMAAGNEGPYEASITAKDGSTIPVDARAKTIILDGCSVRVASLHDITERKQAEEALQESEERFKAQYQGIPVPIYTWRREGDDFVLIDCNEAANDISGGMVKNFIGTTLHELYTGQPNVEVGEDVRRCFSTQKIIRKEMNYHYRTTRETKYLDMVYVPLPPDLVMIHTYDLTERKHAEKALQRSEVLEQLATGASLREILTALVINAEKHDPKILCSVLLLDVDGKHLRHGAAPSLPDFYNDAIDGIEIGPDVGFCGAAACGGERVIAEEIMSHPNCASYRELTEKAGLRACWSEPIISSSGDILGTFTIYNREVRAPQQQDLGFIRDSARLAGIAIEHMQAEEALKQSEERYRLVVQQQTEMICRFKPDFTLTFVNEAYCRYFRKSESDLLGLNFLNLIPEESWESVRQRYAPFTQDQSVQIKEYLVITPDGLQRWQQWTNQAFYDESGKLLEFQSVGRDITELKRAEEALRESEANLKRAQSVAHVGSWELDILTNSLRWSDETYRIFGMPGTDILTYEKFLEHVHPDDMTYLNNAWKAALGGQGYDEEHRIVVDGEIRWVHEKCYFEFDKDGNAVRALGTVQDITERKQIEAKAMQHLEEVAHYSRLSTVGEMTTEIAHELNQPLTSIASYGDTLTSMFQSGNWEMDDVVDALQDITHQALRAGKIIHRLRGLVSKRQTHKGRYDANRLIGGVLQLITIDARRHDVEVIDELPHTIPDIWADKILLEQVILNLMRNAIEAMSSEEIFERHLTIRSRLNDNGDVEIEVSDTGPGIANEQIEKIFEPFYTTKPNGMGMGLSICRSIVEDNGGRLWVNSQPGEGTSFRLTIPVSYQGENYIVS